MFITEGSVRGNCGHNHRTLSGAVNCLERDSNGCHSQGGYSDRSIYQVNKDGSHTLMVQIGDGKYDYEPESEINYE
jgi:hypothetical protein